MGMEYVYKVIDGADSAVRSVLMGKGWIETKVLAAHINAEDLARKQGNKAAAGATGAVGILVALLGGQ